MAKVFKRQRGMTRTNFLRGKFPSDSVAKFLQLEREDTARESLIAFAEGIEKIREGHPGVVLSMMSVGMACDGRHSLFDLWFLTDTGELFATDARDAKYVCKAC